MRVYKTEKNTIRRKAKKCGMNMSEYLRTLGTGAAVREAPRRELMLAYQKLRNQRPPQEDKTIIR